MGYQKETLFPAVQVGAPPSRGSAETEFTSIVMKALRPDMSDLVT